MPFCKERQLYRSFYAILGFYPRRIELYKQALMHKSLAQKDAHGRIIHNERLEFLGDAILEAAVSDIVYHHFKNKQEGFLTVTRSNIVKRETLGRIAVEMGLDKLIMSHCNRQNHNSYLEGNAFEALIGAIYLDQGYKRSMAFIKEKILKHHVNLDKMGYKDANFKSRMLEWGQKHKYHISFDLLSEEKDQSGAPVFCSQVSVEGIVCGNGKGFSKKESQQNACKNALTAVHSDSTLMQQITAAYLASLEPPLPEDTLPQTDASQTEELEATALQPQDEQDETKTV